MNDSASRGIVLWGFPRTSFGHVYIRGTSHGTLQYYSSAFGSLAMLTPTNPRMAPEED